MLLTENYYPQRIVCLTEESVETLYLLGEEKRIVGVSKYCKRPPRAIAEKPKIASFMGARIDEIVALEPDLVIGYSDIQADIAKQLITKGITVWINNHRSVDDIYKFIVQIACIVGKHKEGHALVETMRKSADEITAANRNNRRKPKVYFEEWDVPIITGIRWVSELIEYAGGIDVFADKRMYSLAKDRIIADNNDVVRLNPDIIIASWCGKKFDKASLVHRESWHQINAVQNDFVFEIDSSMILQPGPAALTDGIAKLTKIIAMWHETMV